eukprot:1155758-Pelagomonas_calceolata.AAC.3
MGVDTFLLTEIVEDMSRLFCDQGTTLCSALVHQAAKKLEGTHDNENIFESKLAEGSASGQKKNKSSDGV